MDTQPQELYTIAILGTYAGSSGAVLILYNTFRTLLKKESLWVAFLISLVVSFVVAISTNALTNIAEYFLAFLNACLLFSSATGVQEIIAQPQPPGPPINLHKFNSSWLKK